MTLPRIILFFCLGATLMTALLIVLYSVYGIDTMDTLIAPNAAEEITPEGVRLYTMVAGTGNVVNRYVRAGRGRSIIAQHEIAHAIGHALYEREGTHALTLCGRAFNYGCLHEVLGQAIEEYGAASTTIATFIETCMNGTGATFGPCAHGIGHGLTYFSEYEEGRLLHDLDVCDQMHLGAKRVSPTQSCYTGVFMEYNQRFMYGSIERSFNPSSPLAPCDALSERLHRALCAFWLIPWMHGELHDFMYTDDVFKSLGEFCRSIDDKDMRRYCSLSVARSISVNAYFPAETVERLCKAATDNPQGYEQCIMHAAHTYRSEKNIDTATLLCQHLGNKESVCTAYKGSVVVAQLRD